jgi:hypothetical protein
MLKNYVRLCCSTKNCKAKMTIKRDATVPATAAEIRSPCPKHQRDGDFAAEEYFDAKGKRVPR